MPVAALTATHDMKHFTVTFQPDDKQISVHSGATLVEAAGLAGIILNTVCGEKGTCGKCAVTIQPKGLTVLACQYRITNDLTVVIPSASRFGEYKILTEGVARAGAFEPDIYKKYLSAGATAPILALAIDIGTTTVVVKLIDLESGNLLATASDLNPQTKFGDDVISRIAYAKTQEELDGLNRLIVDSLNNLISDCCEQAGKQNDNIYEACIVGNTTMNHIFLRLPISQLGQAPYKAYSVDSKDVNPGDIGLLINPNGNIHTVANIAGFVGADTTAIALAAGLDSADEMSLAIDIGTNGEIVLGTKNKLFAASCAAGPAFEGAKITCGSRAAKGAIEAVVIADGDIGLDMAGGGKSTSICGSGLIDAVAVLLDLEIIDSTGRFVDPSIIKSPLFRAVLRRITKINDQPAFVLAYDGDKPTVYLTQKDIREFQLAKAAIRAGIKLIQKKLNVCDDDIKRIYLAGAFGNYIRRESAQRIGLLPNVPIERIHSIGNAACAGAELILLSSHWRNLAIELARKIEYIEIAHDPDFQSTFAEEMLFSP